MKKSIILTVILSIIFFFLGFSGHYFWQKEINKNNPEAKIAKLINSKLFANLDIIIQGKVNNKSNTEIALFYGGEELSLPFASSTKFYNIGSSGAQVKEITFWDVKEGDFANVRLFLNQEGNFEIKSVIIAN